MHPVRFSGHYHLATNRFNDIEDIQNARKAAEKQAAAIQALPDDIHLTHYSDYAYYMFSGNSTKTDFIIVSKGPLQTGPNNTYPNMLTSVRREPAQTQPQKYGPFKLRRKTIEIPAEPIDQFMTRAIQNAQVVADAAKPLGNSDPIELGELGIK